MLILSWAGFVGSREGNSAPVLDSTRPQGTCQRRLCASSPHLADFVLHAELPSGPELASLAIILLLSFEFFLCLWP